MALEKQFIYLKISSQNKSHIRVWPIRVLCVFVESSRSTWRTYVVFEIYPYVNYRGRHVPCLHQQVARSGVLLYHEVHARYLRPHISTKSQQAFYLIPTNGHKLSPTRWWIAATVNITLGTPARRRLSSLASRFRGIGERECDLPP